MLKRLLLLLLSAVLVAVVVVAARFGHDLRHAEERLRGRSAVVASPFGELEWAEGGAGAPVLVIHGSGGGWDQGELLARAVLGDGHRWIAPSRFGYLRSTFQAGATFDDQAQAYALLLDHLGLARVDVIALSHGGPSALLFAALHPERVSSLTLISAGVASSTDPAQAQANEQGDALTTVFQHDFLYWALTTAFRGSFFELMGAPGPVLERLTPEQRLLADQVVDFMNPVSLRARGVVFDNGAALPNERISAVRAPTLVLHAKDDTLQLFRNAEFAGEHIAGARVVSFEHGGHLLLAVEQERIRALVDEHLRSSAR
ncbi:MAG: alpha/beta fold hydrolase [Myxococcota bacterium]